MRPARDSRLIPVTSLALDRSVGTIAHVGRPTTRIRQERRRRARGQRLALALLEVDGREFLGHTRRGEGTFHSLTRLSP